MTYQQFLTKLHKTPRRWVLTPGGMIRMAIKPSNILDVCPITALCCPMMKAEHFDYAGRSLGIRHSVIQKIMGAADNPDRHPKIRHDLMEACGLLIL